MLEHLHIQNLALIEDMELDFGEGTNVLTGETGAGKSFILKALSFLLGDRLSGDMVRPGADRGQVEAIFILAGEELILKRELLASSGRSRFHINGALGTQENMRELRNRLVSHTSQHAQQQLLQPQFQAALLEEWIADKTLLAERDKILSEVKEIENEIVELEARRKSLAEKRELLEMQKGEIEKVNPKEGEEEKLESLRTRARQNVAAKQNYNRAHAILYGDEDKGLLFLMQEFERVLAMMSADEPSLQAEVAQISSWRQAIQHLGNTLPKPQASEKMDMDAIEERLFAFAQLKRKLKRTLPEILALKQEIEKNLSFLDICNLDLSRLNKNKEKKLENLREVIAKIIPLRREAAARFATRLEEELRDLGFSEYIAVIPDFQEYELWPGVKEERGRINWAPNPGQNPQPLDKIASGGELSRFLLALSAIRGRQDDITFIFDEVDAGVGGMTLNKLSDKLQELAQSNQIILITHWPQLAVKALKHFHIEKIVKDGNTYTLCRPLDKMERDAELTRMSGGARHT